MVKNLTFITIYYFSVFLMDNNLMHLAFFTAFYLILVGLDTILGRFAAAKKAKKDGNDARLAVKSKITRLGFTTKILVVMILGIFAYILDYFLFDKLLFAWKPDFPAHFPATTGLILIFTAIEIDSLDEHLYHLTGQTILKNLRNMLNKIRKMVLGFVSFKNEILSNEIKDKDEI